MQSRIIEGTPTAFGHTNNSFLSRKPWRISLDVSQPDAIPSKASTANDSSWTSGSGSMMAAGFYPRQWRANSFRFGTCELLCIGQSWSNEPFEILILVAPKSIANHVLDWRGIDALRFISFHAWAKWITLTSHIKLASWLWVEECVPHQNCCHPVILVTGPSWKDQEDATIANTIASTWRDIGL